MSSFSIILCSDTKNGIGKDNKLPWKNKIDMDFLK
jgi:dihydrofolate reductase